MKKPLQLKTNQQGAAMVEYVAILLGTVGVWHGLFGGDGILANLQLFYSYFMSTLALPL